MAKRKNDYRLTRHGAGVNPENYNQDFIKEFLTTCPICEKRTSHRKFKRFVDGSDRQAYQLECLECRNKRFGGYVGGSTNKESETVRRFQENLWEWVRNHIEEIALLEFPNKINIFKGKRGSPRRHKGKVSYSSEDLHPDFIKYLETPEYIKRFKLSLTELEKSDPKLFDYFFFRAAGYSFKQIHDTGIFGQIVKPVNKLKNAIQRGQYQPTEYCRSMNRKALGFLLDSIPEEILNTFGDKRAITNSSRRYERVSCPMCNGEGESCLLCDSKNKELRGTVPRWIYDKYQRQIEEGGTWE